MIDHKKQQLTAALIAATSLFALAIGAYSVDNPNTPVADPQQTQPQINQTPDQQQGQGTTAPGAQPSAQAEPQGSSNYQQVIKNWGEAPRQVAQRMIDKYGAPDGVTPDMIVWNNKGPFRKVAVFREETVHNFPIRHLDVLQETIAYKVPAGKANDLLRFDGSLLIDRTKGLLSARSDSEPMNFLALNLANDIVTGKKSVKKAREEFARSASLGLSGKTSSTTDALLFNTNKYTVEDPDVSIINEK